MLNFEFKNPTKIHFGKGLIEIDESIIEEYLK